MCYLGFPSPGKEALLLLPCEAVPSAADGTLLGSSWPQTTLPPLPPILSLAEWLCQCDFVHSCFSSVILLCHPKMIWKLTVSKYGPRCPAVIWLPSPAGGAAAAILTLEWKRAIRQLHYVPLALWTFKLTLLFKDQKAAKRVPGGAADSLPFQKSFCMVPSARYQHTSFSKAA